MLELSETSKHDNFFDVGGNFLLATQLSLELEHALHVEVSLVKIFKYPTIAALADYFQDTLNSSKGQKNVQERARLQGQVLARRRKK